MSNQFYTLLALKVKGLFMKIEIIKIEDFYMLKCCLY